MGLLRSKSEITEGFKENTKDITNKILEITGNEALPEDNYVNFALDKYKTDSEFMIDSITNNVAEAAFDTICDKAGLKEGPEKLLRLNKIGQDYMNYSLDVKTADAKLLCEQMNINTDNFKAKSELGYNALAILKAEGIEIEQFKELGPNQLDALSFLTSGDYSARYSRANFLLAGMKDIADKEGSIEIELDNGDIVGVESGGRSYKYFMNGEEVISINMLDALGQENLDKNSLDNILSEKQMDNIISKNSKGLENDIANILLDGVFTAMCKPSGR